MGGSSAEGTIKNATSGWTFTGTVARDRGYVLSDLAHDNNEFAVEISLERIGVAGFSPGSPYRSPDDPATYEVFRLGQAVQTAKPTLTGLGAKSTETVPLGYYKPNLKVATSYVFKDVFEKGQNLEIDQTFLFTPYNKDPSHEPTGVVPATRIYPLLKFNTPGPVHKRPRPTYRRITAVQAIYRLHINLTNEGQFDQVGIFHDFDAAGTKAGIAIGLLKGGPSPATQTFDKAEKPLMYEVSGVGIDRGQPGDWDNIHQWSVDSTPMDPPGQKFYVATPGLPYGVHQHWRWGETSATGSVAFSGGPQFAGINGPATALVDPGPALIDPNSGDQTIEFAINQGGDAGTRLEASALRKLDNDPILYLFKPFDQLWTAAASSPAVMLPARDLVTWISITAYSSTYLMPQLNYHDFPTPDHDLNYAAGLGRHPVRARPVLRARGLLDLAAGVAPAPRSPPAPVPSARLHAEADMASLGSDASVLVYQLIDPSILQEDSRAYAEHLQAVGPGRPMEPSFRMSRFGGIRYFDEGRTGTAARPDLVLTDEQAVKDAATKYMQAVNALTAKWRDSRGIDSARHPNLFPPSMVHLRSRPVRRRGSRSTDYWLSLWGLELQSTLGPEGGRSPVIGATVQLSIGARGYVLGVVSTLRPAIGTRSRPLVPWTPSDPGQAAPILVYLAEGAEQPQPFLAPCWADVSSVGEEGGHDKRTFWPASDHTLLVEIEVVASEATIKLRARLPRSPRQIAYADDDRIWSVRWLIADLDAVIDGTHQMFKTLTATLETPGLYHVEVQVEHLPTGVVQTTYTTVPVRATPSEPGPPLVG